MNDDGSSILKMEKENKEKYLMQGWSDKLYRTDNQIANPVISLNKGIFYFFFDLLGICGKILGARRK